MSFPEGDALGYNGSALRAEHELHANVEAQMSASDHFSTVIEDVLQQFLTDASPAPPELRDIAARAHVLPLMWDWGGCFAARPNGEIISFLWDEPDNMRLATGAHIRNMGLYQAAKRYPTLQQFIPCRPADALDCPQCNGTGHLPELFPKNFVCSCGGLGWLPHDET